MEECHLRFSPPEEKQKVTPLVQRYCLRGRAEENLVEASQRPSRKLDITQTEVNLLQMDKDKQDFSENEEVQAIKELEEELREQLEIDDDKEEGINLIHEKSKISADVEEDGSGDDFMELVLEEKLQIPTESDIKDVHINTVNYVNDIIGAGSNLLENIIEEDLEVDEILLSNQNNDSIDEKIVFESIEELEDSKLLPEVELEDSTVMEDAIIILPLDDQTPVIIITDQNDKSQTSLNPIVNKITEDSVTNSPSTIEDEEKTDEDEGEEVTLTTLVQEPITEVAITTEETTNKDIDNLATTEIEMIFRDVQTISPLDTITGSEKIEDQTDKISIKKSIIENTLLTEEEGLTTITDTEKAKEAAKNQTKTITTASTTTASTTTASTTTFTTPPASKTTKIHSPKETTTLTMTKITTTTASTAVPPTTEDTSAPSLTTWKTEKEGSGSAARPRAADSKALLGSSGYSLVRPVTTYHILPAAS